MTVLNKRARNKGFLARRALALLMASSAQQPDSAPPRAKTGANHARSTPLHSHQERLEFYLDFYIQLHASACALSSQTRPLEQGSKVALNLPTVAETGHTRTLLQAFN